MDRFNTLVVVLGITATFLGTSYMIAANVNEYNRQRAAIQENCQDHGGIWVSTQYMCMWSMPGKTATQ